MAAAFSFRGMSEAEFVKALRRGRNFDFSPEELSNKQVVLAIINGKRKGGILAHLTDLNDDADIVRAAISIPGGGMNLQYASEDKKRYGEFIRLAIENSNAEYLCHLVESQSDLVTKRLILHSIPIDPMLIVDCIPPNLQADTDILERLIDAIYQVEDPEQDDPDLEEEAREANILTITEKYASDYSMPEEVIDRVISRATRKRPRIDLTEEDGTEGGGRRSTFRHRRSRNTRGMKKSKRKRRKSRRKSKRSV